MNHTAVLNHYLAAWDLSDPELLASTYTSRIYTVLHAGETVVLKLLAPNEVEEQRGALSLRYFAGNGAVRLLRWDASAHLLEFAPGEALVALVERGDDAAAMQIIAEVIARLHSPAQVDSYAGLLSLDHWFQPLLSKATFDHQMGLDSIYMRAAAVAARLLADPLDIRALHGDIHHYNIRQSARGWLAFDPKGLYGERTYDCANALCNPVMPELVHNEQRLLRNAAILADILALEPQRILAYTYAFACLNASQWLPLGGAEMIAWYLKVASLIEPHIA